MLDISVPPIFILLNRTSLYFFLHMDKLYDTIKTSYTEMLEH